MQNTENGQSINYTDVLVALLPSCFSAFFLFGIRGAGVLAVCAAVSLLSGFLLGRIPGSCITPAESAVSGLLTGFLLPARVSMILAAACAVAAVGIAVLSRSVFGREPVHPVALTRLVAGVLFPALNLGSYPATTGIADSAVFLEGIGELTSADLMAYLTGYRAGMIGEGCIIALIAGGLYLIRGTVRADVPVLTVLSCFALSFVFGGGFAVFSVLSGCLVFAAVFLGSYETLLPETRAGKLVFALCAGLTAALIRGIFRYEGILIALIAAQILIPLFNRIRK